MAFPDSINAGRHPPLIALRSPRNGYVIPDVPANSQGIGLVEDCERRADVGNEGVWLLQSEVQSSPPWPGLDGDWSIAQLVPAVTAEELAGLLEQA